jgi:uncharacterized protein YukE
MFGFSQAFIPAYNAWNNATKEYNTAYTIEFIAKSFRQECAKLNPNMEKWKKTVSVARELESCEVKGLRHEDELRAFKASCVISGEYLEIIGLCR